MTDCSNGLKQTRPKSMVSNAQTQRSDSDSKKFSLLRLARTRIIWGVESAQSLFLRVFIKLSAISERNRGNHIQNIICWAFILKSFENKEIYSKQEISELWDLRQNCTFISNAKFILDSSSDSGGMSSHSS
jgi:hypothetical protein